MKQKGNLKLYSLEEITSDLIGEKGTPNRQSFDCDVDNALYAYKIGTVIKNVRLQQHLTQEQLGKKVGVQKAQISRIEKGYSISIPTMSRVFKALGIPSATLNLGKAGTVPLW